MRHVYTKASDKILRKLNSVSTSNIQNENSGKTNDVIDKIYSDCLIKVQNSKPICKIAFQNTKFIEDTNCISTNTIA